MTNSLPDYLRERVKIRGKKENWSSLPEILEATIDPGRSGHYAGKGERGWPAPIRAILGSRGLLPGPGGLFETIDCSKFPFNLFPQIPRVPGRSWLPPLLEKNCAGSVIALHSTVRVIACSR
jgi:hypothetical protein